MGKVRLWKAPCLLNAEETRSLNWTLSHDAVISSSYMLPSSLLSQLSFDMCLITAFSVVALHLLPCSCLHLYSHHQLKATCQQKKPNRELMLLKDQSHEERERNEVEKMKMKMLPKKKKRQIRCERYWRENWQTGNNGFMWLCRQRSKKKSTFPLQRRATNRSFSSRCWSWFQSQRQSPTNNNPT